MNTLNGWKTILAASVAILGGALGAIPPEWSGNKVAVTLGGLFAVLRVITSGPIFGK